MNQIFLPQNTPVAQVINSLKYLCFFMVIIPSLGFSQKNIRNSNWGDKKEQVLNDEKAIIVKSDNNSELKYLSVVNTFPIHAVFHFTENKLTSLFYFFNQKHTNQNDFISDFESLNILLINKYGKPRKEKVFWNRELYKNNNDKWGFAISIGDLSYVSIWETNDTDITLMLTGENYNIDLCIIYDSKAYKELEEKSNRGHHLNTYLRALDNKEKYGNIYRSKSHTVC